MFKISLRQEKLFTTKKTVCDLSCNLLQHFTNSGETPNSLRSQAFAAQWDRPFNDPFRAYLTEQRMLANFANLDSPTFLTNVGVPQEGKNHVFLHVFAPRPPPPGSATDRNHMVTWSLTLANQKELQRHRLTTICKGLRLFCKRLQQFAEKQIATFNETLQPFTNPGETWVSHWAANACERTRIWGSPGFVKGCKRFVRGCKKVRKQFFLSQRNVEHSKGRTLIFANIRQKSWRIQIRNVRKHSPLSEIPPLYLKICRLEKRL